MVAGGNTTYTCKACGKEFVGWASAKRIYCSNKCAAPIRPRTHGESRTRLYQIWTDMKNRCHCESSPGYAYYGARGIKVCGQWMNSYETFRGWAMANGYTESLELDRRDVNGDYQPGNCRWATRSQQMQNTRKRRNAKTSKFKGVSKHSQNGRWVAQLHAHRKSIYVGLYKTEIEAALAYDDAARERYGEFAHVNFPERKSKSLVTQG